MIYYEKIFNFYIILNILLASFDAYASKLLKA